jgi:HPt (histidine-containing phosphotransfer) domain-containing protein
MEDSGHKQDELTSRFTCHELKMIGVDVDGMVSRLGGKEEVYLSICRKFLHDQNYQLFCTAFQVNDLNAAQIYIHTLKGVAGNLGFHRMEQISRDILEKLKNNDLLFLWKSYDDLAEEYEKIIMVLKEL